MFTISVKDIPINEQITFKEVRVIDADGSQLGILPIKDAIEAAYAKDLDLVNVSPNANPPVCKIMDYGKYRFEIAKREKEAKKNQKVIETKEIRLGLSIDKHDFETKGNHAIQFLKSGNKLKVSIRFRGRELGHPEIGLEIMSRFAEYCSEYAVIENHDTFLGGIQCNVVAVEYAALDTGAAVVNCANLGARGIRGGNEDDIPDLLYFGGAPSQINSADQSSGAL